MRHPIELIDRAVDEYMRGMSQRKVRETFGIPAATLVKHMRRRGLKLSEEEQHRRRQRGGQIHKPYRRKCEPGCTCPRHKPPANKKDFVVLGRKFCQGKCGRWRLLIDFHVRRRDEEGNPTEWQGVCQSCNRVAQRKSDKPRQKMSREDALHRRRERHRWRMAHDPEYAENWREYQRIYSEGRRRAAGVQPRVKLFENRKVIDDTPLVDAGPFIEWFESLNGSRPTTTQLGDALTRRIYGVRSGEQSKIHLSMVDEVAHIANAPEITYILYPEV